MSGDKPKRVGVIGHVSSRRGLVAAAVAAIIEQQSKACPECCGTGRIADYVGLEMKPVGIDCPKCDGSGVRS